MKKTTGTRGSGQEYSTISATELFRDYLRQSVREALWELMQEEVEQLCGTSHQRGNPGSYRRAGSEKGVFYIEAGKQSITRPRVRRKRSDGSESEVPLASYQQARSMSNIEAEVCERMSEGVSTRGCGRLSAGSISAASASRLWVEGSLQKLDELRSREIASKPYVALMVDGIYLGRELVVVVAMGITEKGEKQMLDFAVGTTESAEVVGELITRIKRRGFHVRGRLLAVIDGAQALRKAIRSHWPDVLVQSCLMHKERNLHRYLRKTDHSECTRLIRRIREAQGAVAGREAYDDLHRFLATRNVAAVASLEEAGEELICLHLLDVPATLNISLLSTNVIENAIHNYRRQTNRVTRWQPKTDQVERWTACALLWVEQGFRKIKGHRDLVHLIAALAKPTPGAPPTADSVTGSPLRGADPTDQTPSTPSDVGALTATF
jgi:transposase-like protein